MFLSRGKFNKKKRGESIALYWSTVVQLYQSKNNEPKGKGKKMNEEIKSAIYNSGIHSTIDCITYRKLGKPYYGQYFVEKKRKIYYGHYVATTYYLPLVCSSSNCPGLDKRISSLFV